LNYPGLIGRVIFGFVVAFAGGGLGWLLGACLGAGFPFDFKHSYVKSS